MAALSLIDPGFNQTGRRHVIVSGAHFVGRTEEARQLSVIVSKFGKHLPGKETPVLGILDPLMTGDVPDTSQRISPNLACTFRNVIRHDEDLFGLACLPKLAVVAFCAFAICVVMLFLTRPMPSAAESTKLTCRGRLATPVWYNPV